MHHYTIFDHVLTGFVNTEALTSIISAPVSLSRGGRMQERRAVLAGVMMMMVMMMVLRRAREIRWVLRPVRAFVPRWGRHLDEDVRWRTQNQPRSLEGNRGHVPSRDAHQTREELLGRCRRVWLETVKHSSFIKTALWTESLTPVPAKRQESRLHLHCKT